MIRELISPKGFPYINNEFFYGLLFLIHIREGGEAVYYQ